MIDVDIHHDCAGDCRGDKALPVRGDQAVTRRDEDHNGKPQLGEPRLSVETTERDKCLREMNDGGVTQLLVDPAITHRVLAENRPCTPTQDWLRRHHRHAPGRPQEPVRRDARPTGLRGHQNQAEDLIFMASRKCERHRSAHRMPGNNDFPSP